MSDVKTLFVGGIEVRYVGKPIEAMVKHLCNGRPGWGGNGNVLCSGQESGTVTFNNLEDCIRLMQTWMQDKDKNLMPVCGFIIDYEKRTIYYDTDEALEYAIEKVFSGDEQKYFTELIKYDFKQ